MLPGINGLEICRRLRGEESSYSYIIVLTVKNETKDMLAAMRAGVDDYLAKPFDELELRARLMVGKRILWLRSHANAGASVGISIPLPVNGLLQRSKRL